ncbi:MAG: hypothetical protein ACWIPH_10280 [Ostreibacterium sp.]
MDYVIYSNDEVEVAKNILLNTYFQKKVDSGEMNLIQALVKQKQIDKDLKRGREDMCQGKFVELGTGQLLENIKQHASKAG